MTTKNNNNFNLLRFFFASLVIISHVPELKYGDRSHEILSRIFGTISFGELAVDSFFILSGFLIVKSWIERPNIKDFLSSRILRIYPGFIVSALVCAFIVGPIFGLNDYFQQFNYSEFFIGLLKLSLSGNPSVFNNTPIALLNGSLWTIPYEFICYLLVAIFGMLGIFKKRWLWLSLFIISMILHIIFLEGIVCYFRLLMVFTAGGCFYLYKDLIPLKKNIALISLFLFIICLFSYPLAETTLCIFWGYILIYYAHQGTLFLKFNQFPDISYGIYLYAWPINKILYWYFPNINIYFAIIIVFVFSLSMGLISWNLIEKHFLLLKKYLKKS